MGHRSQQNVRKHLFVQSEFSQKTTPYESPGALDNVSCILHHFVLHTFSDRSINCLTEVSFYPRMTQRSNSLRRGQIEYIGHIGSTNVFLKCPSFLLVYSIAFWRYDGAFAYPISFLSDTTRKQHDHPQPYTRSGPTTKF